MTSRRPSRLSTARLRTGIVLAISLAVGLAPPVRGNLAHPPNPTFEVTSPDGTWSAVVRLTTVHLHDSSGQITEYSIPRIPASVVLTNEGELFVFDSWGRLEQEQGIRLYDSSGDRRWHRELPELLDAAQLDALRSSGIVSCPAQLWHDGKPQLDAATSTAIATLTDGNRLAIAPDGTVRLIAVPIEELTFGELAGRRESYLHFGVPAQAHLVDLVLAERRMFELQPSTWLARSLQANTERAWKPNGSRVVADEILALECELPGVLDCDNRRDRCQAALGEALWTKLLAGLPIDPAEVQAWTGRLVGPGMQACPSELFTIAVAASIYPEIGDAVQFMDQAATDLKEHPRRHQRLSSWSANLGRFGAAAGADVAAINECLAHHLAFEEGTSATNSPRSR